MEKLSLDGIEMGEAVQLLKIGLLQCLDWEWLKVQEISVWWMPLWQNQMLE